MDLSFNQENHDVQNFAEREESNSLREKRTSMLTDMSHGFIQVSRCIVKHWLWNDSIRLKWWFDLVMMAEWKNTVIMYEGHEVNLKPGQLIASVAFLCNRWNESRKVVDRFLKKLIKEGAIAKYVVHNISIITIISDEQIPYITHSREELEVDLRGELKGDKTQFNGVAENPLSQPDIDKSKIPIKTHEGDTTGKTYKHSLGTQIKEDNKIIDKNFKEPKGSMSYNDDPVEKKWTFKDEVISFFNEKMARTSIPLLRSIENQRAKMLKARVKQFGRQAVFEVIEKAADSEFLNGSNKSGFVATFDWMINPNNFAKVLDGNYDKTNSPNLIDRRRGTEVTATTREEYEESF